MLNASVWEFAILLTTWLSYLVMLVTPGAVFVAWLCRQVPAKRPRLDKTLISHYLLPAAVAGILASSLFFLAQVGSVNQRGLEGMFDPVIAEILAQTSLGDGLRWRLSGFFLALIAAGLWFIARSITSTKTMPLILSSRVITTLAAAAMLCIAVSFAVLGHVSQLAIVSRLMLVLHIVAVCLWIGSFVPLYALCRAEAQGLDSQNRQSQGHENPNRQSLQTLMVLFGQVAWIVLSALLISGLWLTWHLTDGFTGLLTSSYGRLLLFKLVLVAGLMILSAMHKFRLVPEVKAGGASRLRRSIAVQIGLAAMILLVTAVLTTLTGPAG